MSTKLSRKLSKKQPVCDRDGDDSDCDEDSMIELGQIAILSSSKASLRYRSSIKLSEMSASQRIDSLKRKSEENNKLLTKEDQVKTPGEESEIPLQETEDELTWVDNLKQELLMLKGYGFGVLSAFSFCLSQVIMKRAKWLAGSDHSTIRYTVTLIIMLTILKYKEMNVFGPKNQFKLLLFRGFCGSIGLISVYFALMFLNPSDVITIMHGSIIITAVLSRIFLNEKLTIAHFIGLILTVIGVIFISKPSVFFPHHRTKFNTTLNVNNSTLLDCINKNGSITCLASEDEFNFEDFKPILGVIFTLVGSGASGVVYLVLKKLCNSKVHWATSTIYVSWFGLPLSLLISTLLVVFKLSHINFDQEKKDLPMDVFYSVCASCLSVTGQVFLNISLRYEDATKIAITKTIDVFFSFVLQYFLLNVTIDLLGLLGACSILTGTFFVLIFKLFENKYSDYLKKKSEKSNDTKTSEDNHLQTAKSISKKSLLLKIIFFKI